MHSEIVTLLRIICAKPESTAENERTFSTLKRVVTTHRESLSDSHVADSRKISFEMRKQFGQDLHKIATYTPEVTKIVKKMKDKERARIKVAMCNLRAKRKASDSDVSPRKIAKRG